MVERSGSHDQGVDEREVADLDAYELCKAASVAVTQAYRLGLADAKTADLVHGRVVARTGARGTIPADDPDVVVLIDLAIAVDIAGSEQGDAEREQRAAEHAHDLALERLRPEAELLPRPDPELLEAAIKRIDAKPSLGALRAERGGS